MGLSHPVNHPIWMRHFGKSISECNLAWADKKRRLARQYDTLREHDARLHLGDKMDVDDPMTVADGHTVGTAKHTLAPLSDEWFADLDRSFNNIDQLLEELRLEGGQCSPRDNYHISDTDRRLLNMQWNLTQCLMALQTEKDRFGNLYSERNAHSRQNDGDCGSDQTLTNGKRDGNGYDTSPEPEAFFVQTPKRSHHGENPTTPTKLTVSSIQLSPGENAIKQLFRCWRPFGHGSIRDMRGLDERMTEVDGFVQ